MPLHACVSQHVGIREYTKVTKKTETGESLLLYIRIAASAELAVKAGSQYDVSSSFRFFHFVPFSFVSVA